MAGKIFLDSNVLFYCAGSIGYRWAVKVTRYVAQHQDEIITDCLLFQEILDRFTYLDDREKAEIVCSQSRKLLQSPLSVTLDDFDRSYALFKKYPKLSPRALLRIATMLNNGIGRICATYSSELESVEEIVRVNLMDKNLENEKDSH